MLEASPQRANMGFILTGSYVFYAVCPVNSCFLVRTLVLETKGKELEEMQG